MKKLVMAALVILTVVFMALPACGSLVPMSWGFPTLFQNSSLVNWQSQFALSNDFETTEISFPTMSTGLLGTSFPQISQITQEYSIFSATSFTNQQESMQFSYPWISIGFSPVPSMGFL